ncbi:Ger(x)C family spore germination protein [Petroclostridium sp. X23]|uniref:Ger(x)C family spore germination protein n=1 Tax=Petroclostridium sp. X23 TaxID=3045146 RepID=UPI0024AE304E|nr:Ger(x)C family spore germination protein [Petroclostridium sp. X23]WHH60215.1 Ger(x)C family spore germination protein [Petroclostridium sp. X23]
MKKKFLFLLLFCILFLSGCWDRKELNDIGIVLATAVDKDRTEGKVCVTSQVVRPAALKMQGGGNVVPVELICGSGNTIFEAIRNMTKQFDRRGYYAHNKVIIIDEHLAKEGLEVFMDFFERSQELRRLNWVFIAKNTIAKEILGVEHGIEKVQATYLESMIKKQTLNSEASVVDLLEFIKKASGSGISPVMGVMEIQEQPNFPVEEKKGNITKGVKLSGTAVFKKDKLVGYLDSVETRGFNWVSGKVKNGVINVPSPMEKDKLISIEIKSASSKIEPIIEGEKISFNIEIKEEGDIAAQQSNIDTSDIEIFRTIEKEQQKVIEKEVKTAIDKIQKVMGSDVLGFGSAISKKYPKKWEEIKDNWGEQFPEAEYTVSIETKLRRTGLISKPIKPAE